MMAAIILAWSTPRAQSCNTERQKRQQPFLLTRHNDKWTFGKYHGQAPAKPVFVSSGRIINAGWCCSVLKINYKLLFFFSPYKMVFRQNNEFGEIRKMKYVI